MSDGNRPTERAMMRDAQADAAWLAIRSVTTARQFEIIILRALCGQSNKQVAADLGVGVACVKTHLAYGVQRVQAVFGNG